MKHVYALSAENHFSLLWKPKSTTPRRVRTGVNLRVYVVK